VTDTHRVTGTTLGSRGWNWRRNSRQNWRVIVAGVTLLVLIAMAVLGPMLYRVDPAAMDLSIAGIGSTAAHPLGTDESGRDLLARLLAGARVSLTVGMLAMVLAVGLGTAVGTVAGFAGGWVDTMLMRLTDAALAVPALFVVILVLTFMGPSVFTLLCAIGATSWMGAARVVRAELTVLREQPFVEAARALGTPRSVIMLRHMLPHVGPTVLVAAMVGVPSAILMESALSFLGLGVQPPAASWGNMLSGGQTYLTSAPRLALWPGVLILVTVLAVNVVGEGVRRERSEA
jgi:peptide/nickel transport system permease protein